MKYNGSIDLDNISDNLYITFVKYIGRKGITNLQEKLDTDTINVNKLTVNEAATIIGTLNISDGVSLRGSILDINGHTTIRDGLDVRDSVTLRDTLEVSNSVT